MGVHFTKCSVGYGQYSEKHYPNQILGFVKMRFKTYKNNKKDVNWMENQWENVHKMHQNCQMADYSEILDQLYPEV